MATITGTFNSLVSGTISGVFNNTAGGVLSGIVGTPGPRGLTGATGPAGPAGATGAGVAAGGTTGQYLVKTSGVDFATGWQTISLSGYLSLDGGEMNANAEIYFEDTALGRSALASGSAFAVSSSSNPDLVSNVLYDRIFVKNATSQTTLKPTGVEFPDATLQTTAFTGWNNVALTGNPTAPTAALADNDTSIATTAFVQQELASGTANARNLEVYVRNQTGSTLAAGTIVYINGATGNRPTVTPAQANNDANSAQTFGFVKTSIANNGFGFVIVRGEVENLDTSALTEGVQLYLSPTTAGTWTTTKPSAPEHLVYVGIVVRAHPTQGVILAAIQNGYELNEIHDVAISSITDGDLLSYESSTTLWKNKSISTLGLATQSWVTSQGYLTSASLSGYAQLSGATFTGEVVTPASTTGTAGLTIPHGVAPTTPVNGEIWTTTSGLFYRINGTTVSPATLAGGTFTGLVSTPASTTSSAGFRIVQGVAPTAPTNGDIWQDGTNMNVRIGGATQVIPALGTANTFTGNVTFNGTFNANGSPVNFGAGTGTSVIGIGPGLTASGSTKTVNIGVNSLAGSTTSITIGSTAGTSTTTLQGTTNGITLAVDTTGTGLATTSFVLNQAGSTTPVMNGTAAVGTSLRYARQDHVHPSDTSRAPLASPSLTGTPLSTTAAADTNTTQIATTAYVVGQASSTAPADNGTAAVGTSLKYARADHVHASDTTKANLASPTFTGTPLSTTAAVDTNTTQIATTAFVVGQGYAKLASPSLTGTPLAPTATLGTNTTQIATTAFVAAASAADVQIFSTAGSATWTKPAGKTMVWVRMYGAGGGGGSGARYATSSIRGGGGGAGSGGYLEYFIPAAALAGTVSVTIGTGGAGGTSISVDSTAGNAGSTGGNTQFSIYKVAGGLAGQAGSNTAGGTGGNPGASNVAGMVITAVSSGGAGGAAAAPTAPSASTSAYHQSTSAGGGAGQAASVTTAVAGAAGCAKNATATGLVTTIAGGAGGTAAGVAATTGASGVTNWYGGTGGGGGYYITGVAAGTGAAGAQPGGGGGGGGASDNGFASGAGGKGGDGMVIVVSY